MQKKINSSQKIQELVIFLFFSIAVNSVQSLLRLFLAKPHGAVYDS
jgi:hypothetical protein